MRLNVDLPPSIPPSCFQKNFDEASFRFRSSVGYAKFDRHTQACTTTVTVYGLHVAQNRSRNFGDYENIGKGCTAGHVEEIKTNGIADIPRGFISRMDTLQRIERYDPVNG